MMGESVVVTHYLPYLFSLLQKHLVKRTGASKAESVPVIVLSMINEVFLGCRDGAAGRWRRGRERVCF